MKRIVNVLFDHGNKLPCSVESCNEFAMAKKEVVFKSGSKVDFFYCKSHNNKIEEIILSRELIDKLRKIAKKRGFHYISDYVIHVLRQVLTQLEEKEKPDSFVEKDNKSVIDSLKLLGYLDEED